MAAVPDETATPPSPFPSGWATFGRDFYLRRHNHTDPLAQLRLLSTRRVRLDSARSGDEIDVSGLQLRWRFW